jgi:hypothetical protein
MSWYAWSIVWWVGLGAVLAVATNGGQGWRKWWLRVAALLLSITTLEQFGPRLPDVTRGIASSPAWMQEIVATMGRSFESVGVVAQLAPKDQVAEIEHAPPVSARP